MQKTKTLRYLLFGLMFALVLVGILVHSYTMLAILMVVGIIIAISGDFIENKPTKPYQKYNIMHNRHTHQDAQV